MEALIFSILTLIAFGCYDFFIARPARTVNVILLGTLLALGQFLVFLAILFISREKVIFSPEIIYPILTGFFGFIGILFYSKSLQTGSAGISSSIANSYPLITIFVATIIFGEIIIGIQYFFFFFIIGGIIFLSFHIDEIRSLKMKQCKHTIFYALGAMLMWAGFVSFFDISVSYFSPVVTVAIAESGNIFLGLMFLLYMKHSIITEIKTISLSIWRDMATVLFCSLFGIFFFAKAFETGSLSFVSAITASSPAITTLLARVFLKEKLSFIQYIAIAVLVLGISGLSYVSL